MSGYNLILKIRRLEHQCERLGFMMCENKNGYRSQIGDVVAIKPRGDSLPIYARDADLFVGTLDELELWLNGIHWAREYDRMLRLSDDKKRERKEQDERNRKLATALTRDYAAQV